MSDTAPIRVEKHSIMTRDNTLLSATLYRPHDHNQHTTLIAGAMGIPQRFYRHYANFLAEQGCVVLSFDYRGIGDSMQSEHLWGYTAHLWEWGAEDLQAMIRWLTRQYPGAGLSIVGHSIGGHLVGIASNNEHVTSLLGVSAQSTHWLNWSLWRRPIVFLFWFILLPLACYAMGYFPSRWFGMGEALPKDIALDWSRGAWHPLGNKGLFQSKGYDYYNRFTGYTCFYSFTDDAMMAPKRAVDAIVDYYPMAKESQRRHVSPESVGIDEIGHIRFFRPEMRETLWQESLNWMLNPVAEVEMLANEGHSLLQETVPQAS